MVARIQFQTGVGDLTLERDGASPALTGARSTPDDKVTAAK